MFSHQDSFEAPISSAWLQVARFSLSTLPVSSKISCFPAAKGFMIIKPWLNYLEIFIILFDSGWKNFFALPLTFNDIDETASVASAHLCIVWVQMRLTLRLIPLDTTSDLPLKDFINICLIDKLVVHISDHYLLVRLTVWLPCIKRI